MTSPQTGDDIVAELLPAFISEADEQIAEIEQLLLQLEDQPGDLGLLDALFRCAHTIKGSAGVFGLDRVVEFTHHVESLLDRLREGHLALTPTLGTLLLESNDIIRELVATALEADSAAKRKTRAALVERLHAAADGSAAPAKKGKARAAARPAASAQSASPAPSAPSEPSAAPAPAGLAPGERRWRLAARFGADTFRHGMDPLSILAYLAGFGRLEVLTPAREAIPTLDALDPESCHWHFDFELVTAQPRERIEHAFSFVSEDCTLQLDEVTAAQAAPAGQKVKKAARKASAKTARKTPPPPDGPAHRPPDTPPDTPPADPAPSTEAADAAPPARPAARPREGAGADDQGGYIRVHANRLDEVINLLGELVIAGAGASQLARQSRQRGLIEANLQISRLIEGIRNSTLKLRMVPIGETFARFRRVVRDTAAALGKDVALEIVGGDTELDKAVVERIADPLMHLVRNALDHGLEAPEQRRAAGKAERGRLTLSACHESGSILIRIIDDGRGIQRDKVLQRAWQRGLVEPGVVPPEDELLRLIFAPGFSTADKVTNLSGRGVGMDVVRSNIEALRGSVAIDSTEGQGSTIEIRLPLTLAIIDGFLVGVDDSRFIFPLDTVVEVVACRPDSVAFDAQGRGVVELRGRHLPVIDLRTLYALDGRAPRTASVVVLRIGTRRFGVLVDQLLGQHQTVIKPLGRLLRSLKGISGSSILGSGEVALIFDVDALGRLVNAQTAHVTALRTPPSSPSTPSPRLDAKAVATADLTLAGDRS